VTRNSDLITARSIQGLFQRAATAAKSGMTVVFVFEEVEHFLPSPHASAASLDISVSSITGMVKHHLGLLENQHIPFFLLGVTNHPERLNATDLSRRFADKVHIKLPDGNQRVNLWRSALSEYNHDVDPAGWQSLSVASEGYAVAEMRSVAAEVN